MCRGPDMSQVAENAGAVGWLAGAHRAVEGERRRQTTASLRGPHPKLAMPLREGLSTMDGKPPAPTNDEPHKPTEADPAAAKAAVDSLIQQLRAASGQPELQDRARDQAKAGRW
jgi:hypothetical protein